LEKILFLLRGYSVWFFRIRLPATWIDFSLLFSLALSGRVQGSRVQTNIIIMEYIKKTLKYDKLNRILLGRFWIGAHTAYDYENG